MWENARARPVEKGGRRSPASGTRWAHVSLNPNVSGGDLEEFQGFVAQFAPALLRAAYLLLRDRNEPQDAVQSTSLGVLRHWRRAKAAPEAYSQTVLVNVCRDRWKHNRRHPTESIEAHGGASARACPQRARDPDGAPLEMVEHREVLKEALERLPALQREGSVHGRATTLRRRGR